MSDVKKRKLSDFIDITLDDDPQDPEPNHPHSIWVAGELVKDKWDDDDLRSTETEQDRVFSKLVDTVYERLMDEWKQKYLERAQEKLKAEISEIKRKNKARRTIETRIVKKFAE